MMSHSKSSIGLFLYFSGVCHHSSGAADTGFHGLAFCPAALAAGEAAGLAAACAMDAEGAPALRNRIMGMWGLTVCQKRERKKNGFSNLTSLQFAEILELF